MYPKLYNDWAFSGLYDSVHFEDNFLHPLTFLETLCSSGSDIAEPILLLTERVNRGIPPCPCTIISSGAIFPAERVNCPSITGFQNF